MNSSLDFGLFIDRKQGLKCLLLVTIMHLEDRLDGSEAQTGEHGAQDRNILTGDVTHRGNIDSGKIRKGLCEFVAPCPLNRA